MSRKLDLESNIRESYSLISEYEKISLDSENPKELKRARRIIDEQWDFIKKNLQEYQHLIDALKNPVIPNDIQEIAVSRNIKIVSIPPATKDVAETVVDAFFSYNSKDKIVVEKLAQKLENEKGLNIWLDKWNLIPGMPWQEEIEVALNKSKTIVFLLGPSGFGKWHTEEVRVALELRVKDKAKRVILVVLPNANFDEEEIPHFLKRLTWVVFSKGLDDVAAFELLVAGILGQKPIRT